MAFVLLFTAASVPLAAPAASASGDTLVYQNQFGSTPFQGFDAPTSQLYLPNKGEFTVGPFSNGGTTLDVGSLAALPAHDTVTIEFDLYTLASWDGNPPHCCNPDWWNLYLDGNRVHHYTFNTFCGPGEYQSYPQESNDGVGGWETNPACGGATESNQHYGANGWQDAMYHLTYTFPHSSSALTFRFEGQNLQGWADEGWALDNVRVSVHETGSGGPTTPAPELPTLLLTGAGVIGAVAIVALRRRA